MRISDWSSDVCSSDLINHYYISGGQAAFSPNCIKVNLFCFYALDNYPNGSLYRTLITLKSLAPNRRAAFLCFDPTHSTHPQTPGSRLRSEEHTSELQSLMRISYAVICLKKKT